MRAKSLRWELSYRLTNDRCVEGADFPEVGQEKELAGPASISWDIIPFG
jgi:hypothetical protein